MPINKVKLANPSLIMLVTEGVMGSSFLIFDILVVTLMITPVIKCLGTITIIITTVTKRK